MNVTDHLHTVRGSGAELECFAQLWEWERLVRESVSLVLERRISYTVFQPVFQIDEGSPVVCGHEAFARFPTAPRVPVGLWFRTSRELGLGDELERLTASVAIESSAVLGGIGFLDLNASPECSAEIVAEARPRMRQALVVDLPFSSLDDPGFAGCVERLHGLDAQVALDDCPLDLLHEARDRIAEVGPDYVKIDIATGLFDSPMGAFNLAAGAAWCRDAGIWLVAERVEQRGDLERLYDLGVSMAQGYTLARPSARTLDRP